MNMACAYCKNITVCAICGKGYAEAVRADAAKQNAAMEWIAVADRLPEQREKPYQVIALCVKRYKEMCYAGEPIRGIYQDWVLRNWPQNYSHWMLFPALPADDVGQLDACSSCGGSGSQGNGPGVGGCTDCLGTGVDQQGRGV
jgi:hypothetical protein